MLCLGSIQVGQVISESCFKGTILQGNYMARGELEEAETGVHVGDNYYAKCV